MKYLCTSCGSVAYFDGTVDKNKAEYFEPYEFSAAVALAEARRELCSPLLEELSRLRKENSRLKSKVKALTKPKTSSKKVSKKQRKKQR